MGSHFLACADKNRFTAAEAALTSNCQLPCFRWWAEAWPRYQERSTACLVPHSARSDSFPAWSLCSALRLFPAECSWSLPVLLLRWESVLVLLWLRWESAWSHRGPAWWLPEPPTAFPCCRSVPPSFQFGCRCFLLQPLRLRPLPFQPGLWPSIRTTKPYLLKEVVSASSGVPPTLFRIAEMAANYPMGNCLRGDALQPSQS